MLIGCHTSIAGGVLKNIKHTYEELDGTAIQIFLGSNHSLAMKAKTKLTDADAQDIKDYIVQNQIFLVVHSCYLLNFAKSPNTIHYALDNLIFDVNLAQKIGALGVVIHMGYKLDLEVAEANQHMVACVQKVIDKTPNGSLVILETPAGQGSQIAVSLDDFANLFNSFPSKYKKRLGICVDTCHIFSAGEDISTENGMKSYFKRFDDKIGKKYLKVIHINDSKKPLNSRKDQHQNLGHGYIFDTKLGGDMAPLKYLVSYCKKNKIPLILETPTGKKDTSSDYETEIKLLRSFS